jgi:hypothetical protein
MKKEVNQEEKLESKSNEPVTKLPLGYVSAVDVMKLPIEEREAILANAAKFAQYEYEMNPDLTDFEAFGEEDLYDETSSYDEEENDRNPQVMGSEETT